MTRVKIFVNIWNSNIHSVRYSRKALKFVTKTMFGMSSTNARSFIYILTTTNYVIIVDVYEYTDVK